MKYIRMFGLFAVAAVAMMALASTASATTVTSPTGAVYTGKFAMSAGETTLHGALGTLSCKKSTIEGELKEHTGTGATTAKVPLTVFTLNECGSDHVTVLSQGVLEVHKGPSTGSGIVTWSGAAFTLTKTSPHLHCVFTTNNTVLGTLTGSSVTKGKAVLDIHSTIPRTGGSFFCGGSATWTGAYTVNTPAFLDVH